MPRPAKSVPSYLHHKASGRAYCVLRRADGSREQVYLGPYNSPESREEYARVLAGHSPAPPEPDPSNPCAVASAGPLTVTELILRWMEHAETYYRRPDGTATNELADYRLSLRPLRHLYGALPVPDLGPLALQRVRDLMVAGYDHPEYGAQPPLARKVVNQRIDRIKRMVRWAASQELVPAAVFQALATVRGLQAGRCKARETEPIEPVEPEVVEKTLPKLNPVLRAMVELQLLTGMRPGEVCSMRADEIDRSGAVWMYKPTQHKTAHRGKRRAVPIGTRAQAALAPFLGQEGFLFSPASAVELVNAERRARRKTKLWPSHQRRARVTRPKRCPQERYTTASYQRAIARAAHLAGVHHWHPNQLRHSFATEVRRLFGLEAAQVVLGHSNANVTQVYAERDQALAARVAAEIG